MTMPAFLVFFFGTIVFVISAITAILSGNYMLVIPALLVYGVVLLISYEINCFTVGNCNLIAWVLGIFYSIVSIMTIFSTVMGTYRVAKNGKTSSRK